MQGQEYVHEVRVLPLGGYDAMLGVDWMGKYNPVTFDFHKLKLTFQRNGKQVTIRGTTEQAMLHPITVKGIKRLVKKKFLGLIGQLFSLTTPVEVQDNSAQQATGVQNQLKPLLEEFSVVFQGPKQLPLHISFDNNIKLKEGAQPVNTRPYRYPFAQKNEIEKMIKEMLDSGIIQHSTRSFASPVLLVKKKDRSRRFCIDYRALNNITIKISFLYLWWKNF